MARPMTDEELAAIAARAEAATPGEWHVAPSAEYHGTYDVREVYQQYSRWWPRFGMQDDAAHDDYLKRVAVQEAANATFIAHARADVPALLEEVVQRRSDVERLTGLVEALRARTNA